MRDVFKKYDGDKSNSIDIQELEKMIDNMFTELSKDPEMKKKKMHELFPCDINSNFESWSESSFKKNFKPKILKRCSSRLLLVLDTDGNGSVSYEEWDAFPWNNFFDHFLKKIYEMDKKINDYFNDGVWEVKGNLQGKANTTNVEWEIEGSLGPPEEAYKTDKLAKTPTRLHCQMWEFRSYLLVLGLSFYCFEDNGKKYKFTYDLYDIYHDVLKGQFSFSTAWTVDDKQGGDKASFTFKRIGDQEKKEEK